MKNLLYIGNKLSKHGNTTTVIETLGDSLAKDGYKIVYASDKKNQFCRLIDMVLVTLLNIKKMDYVLIDTYSTFSFNYVVIISQICRLFDKKYIPILHGGNLPFRLEKSKYLSQLIFKNSYVNVAPSNYLLSAFSEKGFNNLVFIPNTIEIETLKFSDRDFSTPKLLWVRSFSNIYNPKMAIKVLSNLKKDFPNAKLCMVGPDKENLIDECKFLSQELNLDVKFTGKLSKEEWVTLSKDFNIFINTTDFDNTPVSVIEAMALGLPVFSTNVGGIPFLLTNNRNAFLVDKNDAEAMAESIKIFMFDKTLQNTITTNARMLVESFDWNQVKQKWFEILK